ncbi:MAG: hypothetical protein JWO91_2233 [Acidobacteriaceae bacterium]|nr:hypothetical protein [Acidobacteriaceae bacterium]
MGYRFRAGLQLSLASYGCGSYGAAAANLSLPPCQHLQVSRDLHPYIAMDCSRIERTLFSYHSSPNFAIGKAGIQHALWSSRGMDLGCVVVRSGRLYPSLGEQPFGLIALRFVAVAYKSFALAGIMALDVVWKLGGDCGAYKYDFALSVSIFLDVAVGKLPQTWASL